MSSTTADYRVAAYEVQKEKKRRHEADRRKKERDLLDKIREFILKIDPNHVSKLEKLDVLQQALVQIQQLKGDTRFSCLFVNSEKMKTHIREQNQYLKICVNQTRIARKNQPMFFPVTPVQGVPSLSVFLTPPTPPELARISRPAPMETTPVNRKTKEKPNLAIEEEEIDVVNTRKPVWRPWEEE